MKRMKHKTLGLSLLLVALASLPGCWPFGNCGNYPQPKPTTKVSAEVAIGELIDKITILQIKTERISDPDKLKNIKRELVALQETYDKNIATSDTLAQLEHDLLEANKKLWNIEDDIREKERKKEFDQEFVQISRSVYFTNDKRCAIKREINKLLGSRLIEEKSYTDYA